MPTKRQLSKMREAEIEYPQIRREPIDVKPNNMNEQLQAAKDQAAREIYQTDFKTAIIDIIGDYYNGIVELTDRAMEIYAEMRVKKVLDILEANNPTIQQFKTTKP